LVSLLQAMPASHACEGASQHHEPRAPHGRQNHPIEGGLTQYRFAALQSPPEQQPSPLSPQLVTQTPAMLQNPDAHSSDVEQASPKLRCGWQLVKSAQ